jgi:YVTN family beta-propeller protein
MMSRLRLMIPLLALALVGLSGCGGSGSNRALPTQPANQTTQAIGQSSPEAAATPTPRPTPGEPLDERILANIPLVPGGVDFRGPNGMAINLVTNRLYVTFEDTQNVAVLDASTNEIVAAIDFGLKPEEPRWPSDVAVDPSRNRIYVAIEGVDPEVAVIDGERNAVTGRLSQPGYPMTLAVNAATNRLYVARSGYQGKVVSVFDTKSEVKQADIPLDQDPSDVAVNDATNRVYVANYFGTNGLSVIDGNTNQVIKTVGGVQFAARVVTDPTTNRVYVSRTEAVLVLDGATDEIVGQIGLPYFGPGDLVVHPETGTVYALDSYKGNLLVLDTKTAIVAGKTPMECGGSGFLAIDRVGSRIFAIPAGTCDVLQVISIAENAVGSVETVPLGSKPVDVVVDRHGKKLYVANSSADVVSVVDLGTKKVTRNIGVGREPTRLAIDQDANEVYALTRSGLYVIDGATDSVVGVVEVGGDPHDLTLDLKAGRAYVTELKPGDGGIRVIDTRTRTLVQRLEDPFAHFALFCEGIAANTMTGKVYVGHATGGKVSPVVSSIQAVPSGLRETVTGWTQEGGSLTGGITAFDATTLQASAALVLPVYHYGVPIAVDESMNRVYAALNVGKLSAVGLDQHIGLTVIDGTDDVVIEVLVPSKEVSSFFTNVRDMATDGTRSRLFMIAQNDALVVIDTRELAVETLVKLPHGSTPEGLAVDHESGNVYVANSGNGTISVIEIS